MKNIENFHIFSQRIKLIRAENKLTQKEMAQKLRISVSTLSKIERGILPPRLSCSILFQIYEQFGVHPRELFVSPAS